MQRLVPHAFKVGDEVEWPMSDYHPMRGRRGIVKKVSILPHHPPEWGGNIAILSASEEDLECAYGRDNDMFGVVHTFFDMITLVDRVPVTPEYDEIDQEEDEGGQEKAV